MKKLKMEVFAGREQKKNAVEAALLLGFQSETAVFPVISEDGEIPVPETKEELQKLWYAESGRAPEGYEAASDHPGPLFDLDFREKRGLEEMFSEGAFLKDGNQDFLPDKLDVKLIFPKEADASMLIAVCNVAFRLGMETTGYEGELVAEEDYGGNAVIFEYADQTEAVLEDGSDVMRVHIRGKGKDLENFTAYLCEKFPQTDGWRGWRDVLMDMIDDFTMRGADGQLAYLRAEQKRQPGEYELYGAPEMKEDQKEHFDHTEFYNYKSGRKVYEKVYELPWEADVFEEILEKEVYPKLKAGSALKVAGALSEVEEVRKRMVQKIQKRTEEAGAVLEEAELICAYKQGYSWMSEIVIPTVKKICPQAEKVEIYFKPFLPEGQTEWVDENGATPTRNNVRADDPDRWYDLPIRYLQELYPIEDILAEELGIEREQIVFLPYEGEEDLTYLCRVMNDHETCYERSYLAQCSERPYLDEFPMMGKVHPATGFIQVWIDGEELLMQKIRTDLEEVWDVYQTKVLPECRAYAEEKAGGILREDMQPFFNKLVLDVTVSEPDFRTGSREDMISSLDALHEDLYFAGSDYFKNYGVQKAGVVLDAPGLLLPQIHNREGRPVFKVTLYDQLKEKAELRRDGQLICTQRTRSDADAWIDRISWEKGRFGVEIRTQGVPKEVLEAYAGLWKERLLEISRTTGGAAQIAFKAEEGGYYSAPVKAEEIVKDRSISEINLHENELIGYDTWMEIAEELKHVPGIEVFREAVSYTGRELYAVWLKPEYEGYLSMTKRLTRCPSEIINARHHANEVSSTNAALILLKKLLTEEAYRELPDKLNLVIVPMENVDGAAIHYELQKEHPNWKFHVARFNSLGKEFYHEHFVTDSLHTEAMGLTRLYEKFVPDMIVDNHGVPSHEWEQQFSGYTSPSYKGFWLPRSLLYGYFWYVTNPEYKWNYPVNKAMEDVIADKIAEDAEMTAWNKEWSAQFEKYAHEWLPKLFPADYYKNMIDYWIPFAADPTHRYPSIRFPWITTVAYTSEVADETAQGDYLNLCARAHVAHDEATLHMLMQAEHVYRCECVCREDKIFTRYLRQRPMIVGYTGKNKK